jgi:DNA helicase-2/ATP-dependent DNA helicase PcrA
MPTAKKKSPKPAPKKAEPAAAPAEVDASTGGHGFDIGSKVVHPMFGDGTVTAVDGERLTIKFKGDAVKLIIAAFVKPR